MYSVKLFTSLMTKSSNLGSLSLPKFRHCKCRVSGNISVKPLIHDHPFLTHAFFNPKFLDVGHFCRDEVTCFWNRLALNRGIWRTRASCLFHDRFNFYNLKTFLYIAQKHQGLIIFVRGGSRINKALPRHHSLKHSDIYLTWCSQCRACKERAMQRKLPIDSRISLTRTFFSFEADSDVTLPKSKFNIVNAPWVRHLLVKEGTGGMNKIKPQRVTRRLFVKTADTLVATQWQLVSKPSYY